MKNMINEKLVFKMVSGWCLNVYWRDLSRIGYQAIQCYIKKWLDVRWVEKDHLEYPLKSSFPGVLYSTAFTKSTVCLIFSEPLNDICKSYLDKKKSVSSTSHFLVLTLLQCFVKVNIAYCQKWSWFVIKILCASRNCGTNGTIGKLW